MANPMIPVKNTTIIQSNELSIPCAFASFATQMSRRMFNMVATMPAIRNAPPQAAHPAVRPRAAERQERQRRNCSRRRYIFSDTGPSAAPCASITRSQNEPVGSMNTGIASPGIRMT